MSELPEILSDLDELDDLIKIKPVGTGITNFSDGGTDKDTLQSDESRLSQTMSVQQDWDGFISILKDTESKRHSKPQCARGYIDKDVYDTISECDIEGFSRKAIVNGMLRFFIVKYRDKLIEHLKKSNSLLTPKPDRL